MNERGYTDTLSVWGTLVWLVSQPLNPHMLLSSTQIIEKILCRQLCYIDWLIYIFNASRNSLILVSIHPDSQIIIFSLLVLLIDCLRLLIRSWFARDWLFARFSKSTFAWIQDILPRSSFFYWSVWLYWWLSSCSGLPSFRTSNFEHLDTLLGLDFWCITSLRERGLLDVGSIRSFLECDGRILAKNTSFFSGLLESKLVSAVWGLIILRKSFSLLALAAKLDFPLCVSNFCIYRIHILWIVWTDWVFIVYLILVSMFFTESNLPNKNFSDDILSNSLNTICRLILIIPNFTDHLIHFLQKHTLRILQLILALQTDIALKLAKGANPTLAAFESAHVGQRELHLAHLAVPHQKLRDAIYLLLIQSLHTVKALPFIDWTEETIITELVTEVGHKVLYNLAEYSTAFALD